jgi:hypothetical protein
MATSANVWAFFATDASGAPLASLTPTWATYLASADGGAFGAITGPSFVNAGGGLYLATPSLPAGRAVVGVADFGATASPRYQSASARAEDTLTPVSQGAGAQVVTLTVEVDAQARAGARVDVFAGGAVAGQAWSSSTGEAVLSLDPGTYTVRVSAPGASWPTTTVVVGSDGTPTPATLSGTSAASAAVAPVGLSGTASWTAPNYAATIGPLAARDSWTITRTLDALPDDADAVAFTVREAGSGAGTSLVSATVVESAGVVTITLAAGALALAPGRWRYDVQVTVGSEVRTVEIGTLIVVADVTL